MNDTKPLRMYQADIIEAAASETHRKEEEIGDILATTLELMIYFLAKGYTVTLPRFGTFAPTERPAQKVRDIRTGQRITVPAHRQVTFRAGKDLRYQLQHAADDLIE